ncbi:MAG: hypothetical protein IKQ61_03020 [Spirochaetales bacterium]|nr:hypothetical protein [Spirochaetales bacterium]
MKKSIIIAYILSLCALYINAQTVPDGRQLFGAIHQYCQEHYGYLESADISVNGKGEETYILRDVRLNYQRWEGGSIRGYYVHRVNIWDYATIVKKDDGTITINLSDNFKNAHASYDYKVLQSWSDGTKSNYAWDWIKQAKGILTNYLSEPDAKYNEYINSALTDVQFLYGLSKTKNALWVKTFFKRNNVIGRTAKLEVTVTSLEESDNEDYLYKVTGTVGTANQSTGEIAIPITYYSNNDAMLDADAGKKVTITGKIADIEKNDNDGTVSAFKITD